MSCTVPIRVSFKGSDRRVDTPQIDSINHACFQWVPWQSQDQNKGVAEIVSVITALDVVLDLVVVQLHSVSVHTFFYVPGRGSGQRGEAWTDSAKKVACFENKPLASVYKDTNNTLMGSAQTTAIQKS